MTTTAQAGGKTRRLSVDTERGNPNDHSTDLSMSANGHYVAFASSATDLVFGDRNDRLDVYVRHVEVGTSVPTSVDIGTTVRASVDTGGGDPNHGSHSPSISATGRYVAFQSLASDLVAGDDNGLYDVFVRDLVAGTTVRASVDTGGGDPNADAYDPSISDDGRYVAFYSSASDLVSDDNSGHLDVYVRDLVAGTTVRASVDTGGGDPNDDAEDPSISANGRYVAFTSDASDLVAGDGSGDADVFVRDLVAGTTVRASVDTGGGDANDYAFNSSISADGRHVSFASPASDLVAGDSNRLLDIFVRDLHAGTTVLASVDSDGRDANGQAFNRSINADGRYVAFWSIASDLVAGDRNGQYDVFVRDLVAGITIRASVDTEGGDPNGPAYDPFLSADGRYVAFWSYASDLVAGDTNGVADVFGRRLGPWPAG